MKIVVAPDKFKGTVSAVGMAEGIAGALNEIGQSAQAIPLADGGEGFLQVLGGPNRHTIVHGPLGETVSASWRLHHNVAVIEMAQAAGLSLVGGAEFNDPMEASTRGVGELLVAAAEAGARRIIVGVGGSATTDGGLGALKAMHPTGRFRGIEIEVACDVQTTFVDAATVFASQKGASAAQVKLLQRRLERLAQVYSHDSGVEVADVPGSGAAGGLAGGLLTIGAQLRSGFELIAEELELDQLFADADLVITGEGFLDEESFNGKVVGGVAAICADLNVPCLAIVGEVFAPLPQQAAQLNVLSLMEKFGEERSFNDPVGCAAELAVAYVQSL